MKTNELLEKINADLDAGDMQVATESFNLEKVAMEGFFGTKNSAESILKEIAKKVRKAKTAEELDDMLAMIKDEAKKYNDTWKAAKQVAVDLKEKGEDATKEDQKAAKAKLSELDKQLKKTTDILKLSTPGDTEDAYMAACKELQTILDGAQTLITDKMAEFTTAEEGCAVAKESNTDAEDAGEGTTIFDSVLESSFDENQEEDPAMEGFLNRKEKDPKKDKLIKDENDAANAYYATSKKASKLIKDKEYEKAVTTLEECKKLAKEWADLSYELNAYVITAKIAEINAVLADTASAATESAMSVIDSIEV